MPPRIMFLVLPVLLCLAACAQRPIERRSALVPNNTVLRAKKFGLVDMRSAVPDVAVDLRYGTSRNVTGKSIYPADMPCLLRVGTAERVRKAQRILSSQGYGLRIWDAWRPPEAQMLLYQHGGSSGMFLDPRVGWSRHCAGASIDATLVDANGVEQRMPTYFDEDPQHAMSLYKGTDPVIQRNLAILHGAMTQAGLLPLEAEWWHFDDRDFLYQRQPVVYGRMLGMFLK